MHPVDEARRERRRILVGGLATSVLSRGVAVLTPLLLVPVSLDYLGASGFGAWSAALAVTTMLLFADMGIGTGLMTKLGQIPAKERIAGTPPAQLARAYITNAYIMAGMVFLSSMTVLYLTARVVPYSNFFGSDNSNNEDVTDIALVTIAAFLTNIVAGLITRVQYGIGQQAQANLWQSAGSGLTLVVVYWAMNLDPGRAEFVALCGFAPVVASVCNTAWFFGRSRRGVSLRPNIRLVSSCHIRELVGLGSRFLLVTLLLTLCTQIDPWIVAQTAGLEDVPGFSVPARIFAVIGTLALTLTQPLWPLHAQALAAGDVQWVSQVTRRMTVATVSIVGAVGALAGILGPAMVDRWLEGGIDREPLLWLGLAIWWFAQSAVGPAFMAQNGAAILRPQTIGYTVLLTSLPLKWWVAEQYGYVWIPWVGAAAFIVIIWPACAGGYRLTLRRFAVPVHPRGGG